MAWIHEVIVCIRFLTFQTTFLYRIVVYDQVYYGILLSDTWSVFQQMMPGYVATVGQIHNQVSCILWLVWFGTCFPIVGIVSK